MLHGQLIQRYPFAQLTVDDETFVLTLVAALRAHARLFVAKRLHDLAAPLVLTHGVLTLNRKPTDAMTMATRRFGAGRDLPDPDAARRRADPQTLDVDAKRPVRDADVVVVRAVGVVALVVRQDRLNGTALVQLDAERDQHAV